MTEIKLALETTETHTHTHTYHTRGFTNTDARNLSEITVSLDTLKFFRQTERREQSDCTQNTFLNDRFIHPRKIEIQRFVF